MTHSGSHAISATHATTAVAPPSAPHINKLPIAGNASGTVVITSAIPVYLTIPYVLTWAITTHNATPSAANVSETFSLEYEFGEAIIVTAGIPFASGHPLTNSFTMNATTLKSTYAGGALLEGSYVLVVTLVVTNTSQSSPQPFTTTASAGTQLAAHFPTGVLFNPAAKSNVSAGPITISGEYNGSFVNSANVTVYNATHVVVFVQGVFSPQVSPNAQEGFSVNLMSLPGTYTVVLTLGAPYNHTIVAQSEAFTALASSSSSGTTRYVNTTNTTTAAFSFAGLGAGGTAALLIVLGMIVGIIVALLVARGTSMSTAAGPAQPWASQAAGTTAGTTTMANECSVCHQTFATADELKEHAKSQHGITM
ncbi:MAG: C2H2-type zinc finger protein [Thermoplasmata archaeon]|nr:C2H2-type zinc finger protein [Thermoplasmata archaeon]